MCASHGDVSADTIGKVVIALAALLPNMLAVQSGGGTSLAAQMLQEAVDNDEVDAWLEEQPHLKGEGDQIVEPDTQSSLSERLEHLMAHVFLTNHGHCVRVDARA